MRKTCRGQKGAIIVYSNFQLFSFLEKRRIAYATLEERNILWDLKITSLKINHSSHPPTLLPGTYCYRHGA